MHSENPHSGIHGPLVSFQQRQSPEDSSKENEVDKIRAIVGRMLNALDEYTQQVSPENQEKNIFWHDKETPLTVLVKLTQVLARLPDKRNTSSPNGIGEIPENDMERLKAYARRLSFVGEGGPCKPAAE